MTLVLGLMGRKRSGKDSFGAALEAEGFARIAFADAVKDALMAVDPIVLMNSSIREYQGVGDWVRLSTLIKRIGWDMAKELYPEVRSLIQRFGTDAGRDILGEDVWIRVASRKVKEQVDQGRPVVLTDVRFANEALLVNAYGGYLVRIERPDLGPDTDMHASEQAWRDIKPDFIVQNKGSLLDLSEAAKDVLMRLGYGDAMGVPA